MSPTQSHGGVYYYIPLDKFQLIEIILGRKRQKELLEHMVNHLNVALLSKDESETEASVQ